MTSVIDENGHNLSVSVDDPRFKSRELVGIAKDRVNVKDKDGNKFSVSKNDPRYLSGELVHHIKGIKLGSKTVKCPHCNKSGGATAMGRWHFNNCKSIQSF